MPSRALAALAAFVLGCGGDEPAAKEQSAGIALSPTWANGYFVPEGVLPIAGGAEILVRVESAECATNHAGWRPCTGPPIEVDAVEVDPAGAFIVVAQSNEELVLRAAAEGPAKLTVRGSIEGVPAQGEYGFDVEPIGELRASILVRDSEDPLTLADGVRLLTGERYSLAFRRADRRDEFYSSVSPMTVEGGRLEQDEAGGRRYLVLDRAGTAELRLASGQTLSLRAVDAPTVRYEWESHDGRLVGDLRVEDEVGEAIHLPYRGPSGTVALLSAERCRISLWGDARTELPLSALLSLEAVGDASGTCELEVRRGEQRQRLTVDLATAGSE